ncbi:asparagine synthase-related protein [Helicobacter sp. 11S02629-2]|uniref:asparagine synthase-related protein n=1 Tax=Helicobacter sp. 11S02629-2 TaxID=1476195 RepID=UPI000BA74176|nr:asparagine synthase-related protein [Helicobacter sp. 11S02629-2]PAF45321.1 asparagine synthase [Helicobacter sp. 11S02629-2]
MVDKTYCMSNYLAFRFISNVNINFYSGLKHSKYTILDKPYKVRLAVDVDKILKEKIMQFYEPKKTALFLSGGIDSAILASYLPKDTKAYTFKCIGENAIDETSQAKKYTHRYALSHEIIEMHWSDFEKLTPKLLESNQVPFHSIEVQLLKAALHAKTQGIEKIIIGDSADYIFGGMDKLLSKDWNFEEFVTRYNYIEPSKALKDYVDVTSEYEKYKLPNNKIDFIKLINNDMLVESLSSYANAFKLAGISFLDPYSYMQVEHLDLQRIRAGEPKYLLRELFKKAYPDINIPTKIPMPRAMDAWLKDYKTSRPEFIKDCTVGMSGDQKWLCWCLEQFLNMYEKIDNK